MSCAPSPNFVVQSPTRGPGVTHPRPSPVLSPELRTRLGEVIEEARRVAQAGAAKALEALAVGDPEPHEHHRKEDDKVAIRASAFRNRLRLRGRQAGDKSIGPAKKAQQTKILAHEVSYNHWHRILFARFLAENDLLIEPEYKLPVSLDDCRDLARDRGQDNHWELAGGWIRRMLPELFRADDPVLELSLPPETGQDLEKLLDSLPAQVFTARDALGWTYQHWRSDEKDSVNMSEVKIGADEIPAVTQLFTERYMVLFLLHNTIGAWWAGKVLAQDPALAALAPDEDSLRQRVRLSAGGGYDFTHLRFVRTRAETDEGDERTGPWRPVAGTFPDWPQAARQLRILDPCCGSGHFLVEAFELLARLRIEEDKVTGADAARAVLGDNLFGLEIDPRCKQIAVFHVALAAWRLAGGWIELPALNIACSGIGPECSEADWGRLAAMLEQLTKVVQEPDLFSATVPRAMGPLETRMRALHRLFNQARELGSLIEPESVEGEMGRAGYDKLRQLRGAAMLIEREEASKERVVAAEDMARAAKILRGSYTLVVTNVPFLARGKQAPGLREFAVANHGDAKGDLATVFASRIFGWLGGSGTQALVMPQNWLFLKTYRRFRERLLRDRKWHVVARLGPGAFETISGEVVNVALVILSAGRAGAGWEMMGMDVSSPRGQPPIRATEKARLLAGEAPVVPSVQEDQLANPDAAVLMRPFGDREMLGGLADGHQGIATADYSAYGRMYWEISSEDRSWVFQQSTVKQHVDFGGREHVLHWEGIEEAAKELIPGGRKKIRIQGGGTPHHL